MIDIAAVIKLVMIVLVVIVISVAAYYSIKAAISAATDASCDAATSHLVGGKCILKCDQPGQYYDPETKQCVCTAGYTNDGGTCIIDCSSSHMETCGSSCYNPASQSCVNSSPCPFNRIKSTEAVAVVGTLDPPTSSFFITSTGPDRPAEGEMVTVSPALLDGHGTVIGAGASGPSGGLSGPSSYLYYRPDGSTQFNLSLTENGPIQSFLASARQSYTVLTHPDSASNTCCDVGTFYDPTKKQCMAACASGTFCAGACCSGDKPLCGANGICCAVVTQDGSCCDEGQVSCGGKCCSGKCDTDGQTCLTKCEGDNSIFCANGCVQYKDSKGTEVFGCLGACESNWDDVPTYTPARHNGFPVCSPKGSTDLFYCGTVGATSGYEYTTIYTNQGKPSACTAADCGKKGGQLGALSTTWDPGTSPDTAGSGTCTIVSACNNYLPACSESCPVASGDVGACCDTSTPGAGKLVISAGVRPSDKPACAICSGRGTLNDAGTCVCSIPQNWKNSPYSGEFCENVNAHCTDWAGTTGSSTGGMCPGVTTIAPFAPRITGGPNVSINTYAPGVPAPSNSSTNTFDTANIICVTDPTTGEQTPAECGATFVPTGQQGMCAAPSTDPNCTSCIYNGVAGCIGTTDQHEGGRFCKIGTPLELPPYGRLIPSNATCPCTVNDWGCP